MARQNKMVAIDRSLRDQVKVAALQEKRTMQYFVEAAVTKALAESKQRLRRRQIRESQ